MKAWICRDKIGMWWSKNKPIYKKEFEAFDARLKLDEDLFPNVSINQTRQFEIREVKGKK